MSKYHIIQMDENNNELEKFLKVDRPVAAQMIALKWVKEQPSKKIFVEIFRRTDGQKAYLNREGVELTGKAW